MKIDRALVDAREPGAELDERGGGESERHVDDVRSLEVERPVELDAALGLPPAEMILDDRDEVLAQGIEVRERKRIDDGEALGEGTIADLEGGPPREVVAVGGGEGAVPEKVAERVEEDRGRRRLREPEHELALVERVNVERLAQLDAAREAKGVRGRAHTSSGQEAIVEATRRSSACISRTPRTRYSAAVGFVPTQIVTARPRSATKADSSVVSSPAYRRTARRAGSVRFIWLAIQRAARPLFHPTRGTKSNTAWPGTRVRPPRRTIRSATSRTSSRRRRGSPPGWRRLRAPGRDGRGGASGASGRPAGGRPDGNPRQLAQQHPGPAVDIVVVDGLTHPDHPRAPLLRRHLERGEDRFRDDGEVGRVHE